MELIWALLVAVVFASGVMFGIAFALIVIAGRHVLGERALAIGGCGLCLAVILGWLL